MKYPLCVLSSYHLSSCEHRKLTLQNCQYCPPLAKATQLLAVRKWQREQTVPQTCSWLESPPENGPTSTAKCDCEDNSRLWRELYWSRKSFNSYILGVAWLPMITGVKGYLKQLLCCLGHFKIRQGSQALSCCQFWWAFHLPFYKLPQNFLLNSDSEGTAKEEAPS